MKIVGFGLLSLWVLGYIVGPPEKSQVTPVIAAQTPAQAPTNSDAAQDYRYYAAGKMIT
jgi:hypothetical protein